MIEFPGVSSTRLSHEVGKTVGRRTPRLRPPLRFRTPRGGPGPFKGRSLVKPKPRTQSTPATPARRNFTPGPRAFALGLASSTVVVLPIARAALPGEPRLALLIGLIPLLPYVLTAAAFAAIYVIVAVLAVFVIMRLIVTGRDDPLRCLTALFTWLTNPPIAFMTLRPVSFAALRSTEPSRRRASSLSPLPAPPPGAAAKADDPLYYQTLQHLAQNPGGRPDIVPPTDQASEQARGRHARQEAPESVETPSLAGSPA